MLQACSSGEFTQYDYLKKHDIPKPSQEEFSQCYRYGCDKIATVKLSSQEWLTIDNHFAQQPDSAEQERENIRQAIGTFEKIVGEKTGTKADIYGTFRASGPYQQDCIDESTNTTIYLSLLEQRGLLNYHTVLAPQSRVPLIHSGRWPHRTAQIQDTQTKIKYAVDSWFHDNGFPAEIVPMALWKKGWKAEENLRQGSASDVAQ